MRETKFEKYKRQYLQKVGYETINSLEEFIALLVAGHKAKNDRVINPTQLEFIKSADRFKAYMGAAGVAKTTTGCADVIMRALFLPGSKWFIARRDYNDLKGTTLASFYRCIDNLPEGTILDRAKEPPMRVWLRPVDLGNNAQLPPSEITFMGLSDNVGSYEFNGGFIDEADECERTYVEQLKGRMRWKPYPHYPEATGYMFGLAFNPPDKNHWLYTACTGLDANDEKVGEPMLTLFRPQSLENDSNLPAGYRAAMAASMPEDLRQRLVDGDWGSVFPGAPVFPQFKAKLHLNNELKYGGGTLFRFWDFGYNRPYCCLVNMTRAGHLQIFAEVQGFKKEIGPFIQEVLRLEEEFAPAARAHQDIGDVAVKQHKDTGSALSVLHQHGIIMRTMQVPFDISLRLFRARLEQLIDGVPALQWHPRCRVAIAAMQGGYHFKEDGVTPKKDGYYDHSMDTHRYGIYNLFGTKLTTADADQLPTNVAYWSK